MKILKKLTLHTVSVLPAVSIALTTILLTQSEYNIAIVAVLCVLNAFGFVHLLNNSGDITSTIDDLSRILKQ